MRKILIFHFNLRAAGVGFALVFLLAQTCLGSDDRTLLYPIPDYNRSINIDWLKEIRERVPPLTNELNDRWPLMLWRTIPVEQITPEAAEMLLERGLVPSLPLDRSAMTAAKTLQSIGAPVILTAGSGAGTAWPYNLAGEQNEWAYEFDDGIVRRAPHPVPTRFSGWAIAAEEIRETLRDFRQEGITVDAAWLDYEGLPFQARYGDAIDSVNGREYLPAEAIENPWAFIRYTRQLWISLLSTYVAAPIREIYPKVSVTNWLAVLSLPEFPALSWYGYKLPMVGPTMFTASNPVAYGIDTAFNAEAVLNAMTTRRDVDRIYTEILLRQVSADSYARDRIAPEVSSVVWIARWVRDDPWKLTPVMGRTAYREALRHLWLRGVDAMAIFSPVRENFSNYAIQEIEDAAAVFDEFLGFSEFLNEGDVIRYDYKIINQDPVLWSGLQSDDRALVRIVSFDSDVDDVTMEPWPGVSFKLTPLSAGVSYILNRSPQSVIPIQNVLHE